MISRDARRTTTTGAALARGGLATISGSATGWTLPVGPTPLTLGLIGAIGLLVYLDRRVVFK